MIYVLAVPQFEPNVAVKIDRFRSVYEPERAKLVPPHVTLVFGLRDVRPQDLLAHCEAMARPLPQLAVDFTVSEVVYDPFEDVHKLCLLSAGGAQALTHLHHQLYDGPHRSQFNADISYRPHMTVATHKDRATVERLDVAELGVFPISGTIKAIEVFELVENALRSLGSIPLGA